MNVVRAVAGPARDAAAIALLFIVAAAIGGVFILAAGKDPVRAYGVLLDYTLASRDGFFEMIVHAIPIALAGVGLTIAFRANVFNIGVDGQAIVGAIVAVAASLGPWAPSGPLALAVFLLVGFAAGAAYGGIAGWLRARYNANEIVVTIMLNYIALQLLAWAIRGPLQESMKVFPRSDSIVPMARLELLFADSRVHAGLIVALLAALVVFALMRWSSFGYQLRAVGISRAAARYGGARDRLVIFLALALSGAFAGLAGAVEIAGIHHRLQDDFAPGLGNGAIAAALLARLQPLAVPATAMLFGLLHAGAGAVQREVAVPFPIVWIIEGIVILAFLVLGYLRERRLAVAV